MKRNEIFSALALLISLFTLMVVFAVSSKTVREAKKPEEIQQQMDEKIELAANSIRSELVEKLDAIIKSLDLEGSALPSASAFENMDLKDLARQAKTDPAVAKLLRAGIESVILQEMADELAAVDWLDALSQEKLRKLLARAAQTSMANGFSNLQTPVDVSDIEGVDGKVARILQEFEGLRGYSSNNALVKQLQEMGDDAIEPLLSQLAGRTPGDWTKQMAIKDALNKLLTEEHEEIILAEFTKTGSFSELIEKYQFPAAKDEVMNKISYPSNGRVDNNVVDAALKMDPDRSIPLLVDYVGHGQNVSYAASQLAAEGVDIAEPLRLASTRANNTWEKASLVELCLDRNMPEGYDLAIQVLRSNEMHAEHSQEKVYQYIRKYTGINGSYNEVADWLQENHPN